MREVRFRYRREYLKWKEIHMEYYTLQDVEKMPITDGECIRTLSRDEFIGCKDTSGRNIYEGDIINDNGYYGVREVFYNKGGWNIKYISGGKGCRHSQRFPFKYKQFKVIGNIYSNLETK